MDIVVDERPAYYIKSSLQWRQQFAPKQHLTI